MQPAFSRCQPFVSTYQTAQVAVDLACGPVSAVQGEALGGRFSRLPNTRLGCQQGSVALAGSGATVVCPDACTPKALCSSALLLTIKTMAPVLDTIFVNYMLGLNIPMSDLIFLGCIVL